MGRRALDLEGRRFGRLEALHIEPFRQASSRQWMCKCNCGNVISVVASNLKRGHTKSCGCLQIDISRAMRLGNRQKLWELRNE